MGGYFINSKLIHDAKTLFSDLQNFCISTFDFLDLGVGTGFKKKKSKRWPHLLDY
jgi:hypothetical protein